MASEPRLDEASTAAAAARRFWRLVSIASLTIFLIGTHWPKLRLPEVEGGPASDKLIHFIAFALLAVPVWWTGWFSRLRTLTIAGALFAIFDEVTQELLPIDRFMNLDDLVCDLCGLVASVSILATIRTASTDAQRTESARRLAAHDRLLAKPLNWANLAVAAALGVVVVVPLVVPLAPIVRIDQKVLAMAGAGVGAAAGGLLALEFGTRATLRRLRRQRACPRCGGAETNPPACACCGERVAVGFWSEPASLPFAARAKAAAIPVARSAGLLVAIAGVAMLFPAVTSPFARFEPITLIAIDLLLASVAIAWAIDGTRRRLGAMLEHAARGEAREDRERSGGLPGSDRGGTMAG